MRHICFVILILCGGVSAAYADIPRPTISEKELAILNLDLIQKHFEAGKRNRSFFSSSSDLNHTLLQDIALFTSRYHQLPIVADALFLKGEILLDEGEEEAAGITWLQVLYVYPSADIALQAKTRLQQLLKKDWDDYSETIQAIIGKQPTDTDPAMRLLALIRQLYKIDDKKVDQALVDLQLGFLRQFPTHPYVDEVQVLLAHTKAAHSAKSGVFEFEKLLALYPGSSYRPEAMLAIADLQRTELKQYDKAATYYTKLIQAYPKHPLRKYAYTHLAWIQAKEQKDYPLAVSTLQTLVKQFPKDELSLKGLQHMADLQEKRLKQPQAAIQTLSKLARMFPDHPEDAIDALRHAAKLARKKLNNPEIYKNMLLQIAKDFPQSDAAPKALYTWAEFAEKKLNDSKEAQTYYLELIRLYPNSKQAEKARKRLP